jgi:hypothetical protein
MKRRWDQAVDAAQLPAETVPYALRAFVDRQATESGNAGSHRGSTA